MSVTIRSGYDAIQADGQRIEFGERRQIVLQRPDKVRVERAGTVDQALVYMVRDLQATVPLARMFTTFFAQDLDKCAASVTFVEKSRLFDVPTDHLAVRSADVGLQLWIAQGPTPLPRRVVIIRPGSGEFTHQARRPDDLTRLEHL